MANLSNDLSCDPSQLSLKVRKNFFIQFLSRKIGENFNKIYFQQRIDFFEKNLDNNATSFTQPRVGTKDLAKPLSSLSMTFLNWSYLM